MKIDLNNIANFGLKDKSYLSNNVLRFKMELYELHKHHNSTFANKYEKDKEYREKINSDFYKLEVSKSTTPKKYFEKAFEHLFNADFYYTNGQNLISLKKNENWEIVSYESVFNFSIYHSTYYPFNYNPLGKTNNSEYQIFDQSEQKIFEELNNIKIVSLPLSRNSTETKIQEVYPDNCIMTMPDGSKMFLSQKSETEPSVNKQIIELNKPNLIETCLNCEHFQFSGMSHDMSGGTTGYCFLVRNQLIEKSVKEQVTNIWSRCMKFKNKEKS